MRDDRSYPRTRALCTASAVLLLAAPAHAELLASLRVETSQVTARVNRDVYGANFEYIGADVPAIEPIVAGTPLLRFPGGDDVSGFVWSAANPGSCAAPQWSWDRFAALAQRQGAAVMLETNIVRDTPQGVAAWVLDARRRGLRVAWLGIGNEVWGSWDAGYRTAERYAADVHAIAAAVRAVAPETRLVLEIGTFAHDAWNREALRRTADVIDAVDYHYYPNHASPADPVQVAAGADGIAPLLARLRAMIAQVAPARAEHIGVILGEWDGAVDPPRPGPPEPGRAYAQWAIANALFYGAAVGEMLTGGVAAAMFYELQGYRFGAVGGNACLAADYAVRRPKELALRLYREHFGVRLLSVVTEQMPMFFNAGPTNWDGFAGDAPVLRAYASLTDDERSLRVVMVNRSPDQGVRVRLAFAGFEARGSARVFSLTGDSIMATNENVGGPPDAVRIAQATAPVAPHEMTVLAPPHSVVVYEIDRAPGSAALTDAGTVPRTDAGLVTPADAGTDARSKPPGPAADAAPGGCASRPGRTRSSLGVGAALASLAIIRRAGASRARRRRRR